MWPLLLFRLKRAGLCHCLPKIPKFNPLTRELFAKSALLAEIRDAQTRGRLVFLSAAQRDGDQDDQREQIRQHLEDLIRAVEQAGD